VGDVIQVLEKTESGSWIGYLRGRTGHFPFVDVDEVRAPEDVTFTETDVDAGSARERE
jgi:hypothetical protein